MNLSIEAIIQNDDFRICINMRTNSIQKNKLGTSVTINENLNKNNLLNVLG